MVFKLTKMVTEGLIMEDTSRNNGLNYRKMNSKDDIGAVYRLHIPRMYNLVLAVVRAHSKRFESKEIGKAARERWGGGDRGKGQGRGKGKGKGKGKGGGRGSAARTSSFPIKVAFDKCVAGTCLS